MTVSPHMIYMFVFIYSLFFIYCLVYILIRSVLYVSRTHGRYVYGVLTGAQAHAPFCRTHIKIYVHMFFFKIKIEIDSF